jgi:hypothetical protein
MKWWQFFFLMATGYVGPHMSAGLAVVFGAVLCAVGLFALWRDD